MLSRELIIEHVWDGRVVSDDTLNRGISLLRQALNPAEKTAYIKTVPKRGYKVNFNITKQADLTKSTTPDINSSQPPISKESKPNRSSLFRVPKAWITSLLLITMSVVTIFILDTADNARHTKAAQSSQSIAVLPFLDVSNNEQSAYIGEGISDTIISTLSNQQNLQVIARTSTFSLDQETLSIAEIANKLGANYTHFVKTKFKALCAYRIVHIVYYPFQDFSDKSSFKPESKIR